MKSISLTDRIIFGLKAKQLRLSNKQSFADLAAATGMSISYLNEIEKGKKFPKQDKIDLLATALGTSAEELTDGKLGRHLAPVENLLRSNFLNELPLDLFGIELNKVAEIVAGAPVRVAAFISTLLELSRSYNLREENFYFAALRSYLELHENFFPEIEAAVADFCRQHDLPTGRPLLPRQLAALLEKVYGYTIVPDGLEPHADLRQFRSVYLPKSKQLLLNSDLKSNQLAFQYGKEIAFNFLKLKERAFTSSLVSARSFEEVINHSKAVYFSAALHLPLQTFHQEIDRFFKARRWDDGQAFLRLMVRYNVTPETFYHRLTNLIPHYYNYTNLFFLRFVQDTRTDKITIDRELHLDRGRHHPRANATNEHYCRRWISIKMLMEYDGDAAPLSGSVGEEENLRSSKDQEPTAMSISAQRSRYLHTEHEYLCITVSRRGYPSPHQNVSVTIGLLINDALRNICHWVDDPAIESRLVNITCERCDLADCAERAAPPKVVDRRAVHQRVQRALKELGE